MKLSRLRAGLSAVALMAGLALSGLAYANWNADTLTTAPAAKPPAQLVPADAQTRAIVAAAQSFLASLTEAQRSEVIYAFGDAAQRHNWSNFPNGVIDRGGLPRGALSAAQRNALDKLLATVLSPDGQQMVQRILQAEDIVASATPGGNTQAGRAPVNFGSDWYYVSFLGQPSEASPWMLQFGGHHLALNITVAGAQVTLAPMLTGGQPMKLLEEGQTINIAGAEIAAAHALMDSLTAAQRESAWLSTNYINWLLGPGEEGRMIVSRGLAGSQMTEPQRKALMAVVAARVGVLNADDAAAMLSAVEATLDQTHFAWFGPREAGTAAYWRVTGPRIQMEFSPQDNDGDPTDHVHAILRDPANDYGKAWVALGD